jgi:hypothetical protein
MSQIEKAFNFKGNEYHLKATVKNISGEAHYFVDLFLESTVRMARLIQKKYHLYGAIEIMRR